jgi:hypothetical protein
MTEDLRMPSNRLCEIFHATLEILYDCYHSSISFVNLSAFLLFHQSIKLGGRNVLKMY